MKLVGWFSFIYLFVCSSLYSATAIPNLAQAAEYYFAKHDYSESLKLWQQLYQSQPESLEIMEKVAELQLMLEGHESAQKTISDFRKTNSDWLSWETDKRILNLLNETQSRFVKAEAQSLYFQARSKIKLKNFSQALGLLNQSWSLEKGNVLILVLKADCEKTLGLFSKYYETVKIAAELTLYDKSWMDQLLEAQFYFKDYKDILSWYESQKRKDLTVRQTLAVGMAYIDTKNPEKGIIILNRILDSHKVGSAYPIVWYGMGKAWCDEYNHGTGNNSYWDKFVRVMKVARPKTEDSWDPYGTLAKLNEVTKLREENL